MVICIAMGNKILPRWWIVLTTNFRTTVKSRFRRNWTFVQLYSLRAQNFRGIVDFWIDKLEYLLKENFGRAYSIFKLTPCTWRDYRILESMMNFQSSEKYIRLCESCSFHGITNLWKMKKLQGNDKFLP